MKKALPNTVEIQGRVVSDYRIISCVQTRLKQSKPSGRVNQPDYIHAYLGQVIYRTHLAGWQLQLQAKA